jgi:polysaccharide biosynthesis protein VpsM
LNSSSTPKETNGTGSFIDAQDTSLTWLHAWSDDLNTTLSIADGTDEYERSFREDDRQNISLSLKYDWRRWATVGASYTYSERDSNQNLFDFEKNIFAVSLDMSL